MARLNIPKRELGGQQIQLGDVGGIGRAKEKLEEAEGFTRVVDSAMRLGAGISSMAGKAREEDQRKQLQILGTQVKADSTKGMTVLENRLFQIPEGERSQESFGRIAAEGAKTAIADYTKRIEGLPEGKLKDELRGSLAANSELIQANYEQAAAAAWRSEAPREKARRDQEDADLTRQELAVATAGSKALSAQAEEDFQEALTESSIEQLADPNYLEALADQFAGQEMAGLLSEATNISSDEARNNYLEVLERGREAIYSSYRTKAKGLAQAAREFIANEENNSAIEDALGRRNYSSLSAMIGSDGTVATDARISVLNRPGNARSVTGRVETEIASQLRDPINGAESALSFSALPEEERGRFSQSLQNLAASSLAKLADSAYRSISGVSSSLAESGDLPGRMAAIEQSRRQDYRSRIRPLLERVRDSRAVDDQAKVDAESTLRMFTVLDKMDERSSIIALSGEEIIGSGPEEQMARQKVGARLVAGLAELVEVLSDQGLSDDEAVAAVDQYAALFASAVEQLGVDQSETLRVLESTRFDGPMGPQLFAALDRRLPEVRNASARRQLVEGIKKQLNIKAMLENLDPKDRSLVKSALSAATTFGEVTDIIASARGNYVGIAERLKSEARKIPDATKNDELLKQYETSDPADLLLAHVLMSRSSKGTVYNDGSHSVEVKKKLSFDDALAFVQAHPYLRSEFYAQAGMLGLDAIGTSLQTAIDAEMPEIGNSAFSGSALVKNPPENYFVQAGELFSLELEMGFLSDLGIDMDQVAGAKLVAVDGESATYEILRKTVSGSKAYITDENGDVLQWTVNPESSYSRLNHLRTINDRDLTERQFIEMSELELREIEASLADVRSSEDVIGDFDSYEYAPADRDSMAFIEQHLRKNPEMTLPVVFGRADRDLLGYLVGENSYGLTPDPNVIGEYAGIELRKESPGPATPQRSKIDFRLDQNHMDRGLERVMSETGIPEAEARHLLARGRFAVRSFLEMQPKYEVTPGLGASLVQGVTRTNEPVTRDRALVSTEDFQGAMFFLRVAEESAKTLYEIGLKMDEKPPGWDRLESQRKGFATARAFASEAYKKSVGAHMENVVMPMVLPMLEAEGSAFSPPTPEGSLRPSQPNTEGNVRQYIRDRINETFLFENEVSKQGNNPLMDSLAEAALTGNASGWSRVFREFLDNEIKENTNTARLFPGGPEDVVGFAERLDRHPNVLFEYSGVKVLKTPGPWKSEWQRESERVAKEREEFYGGPEDAIDFAEELDRHPNVLFEAGGIKVFLTEQRMSPRRQRLLQEQGKPISYGGPEDAIDFAEKLDRHPNVFFEAGGVKFLKTEQRMSPRRERLAREQLEAGLRLRQQKEEFLPRIFSRAQIVRENIEGFASGAIRAGISREFWEDAGAIAQTAMILKLEEHINEAYEGAEEGPFSPFSWQDYKAVPLADTNKITSIAMKEAVRVYRTQIENLGGSEDISLDVATEAFRDGIESALDSYFRENPIRRSYMDESGKFHRREFLGIELPWPPAVRDVPTPDQEALLKFGRENDIFIRPAKSYQVRDGRVQ